MNRSNMPKQVMTFSNGGLASFIPRQTVINRQPHSLAYINPQEAALLRDLGGSGNPGPGGIPAYDWSWSESSLNPKNWGGGGNNNNNGGGNDNGSTKTNQDRINEIYASSDKPWETHGDELNDLVADRGGTYSGGDNNSSGGTQTDDDRPAQDVGLVNSLLMGVGLKDPTPEYYSATADTLARQYGPERAQTYINEMRDKGNITTDLANALMESTTITGEDYIRRGLITDDMFITNPTYKQMLEQAGGVKSSDDNGSGSDQTGGDQTDGEEGDGEDEEAAPPSSMNFRFYGGYQPRTQADVLVASPTANTPFVMPDDPRFTPLFNPDDNIDEILNPTPIGPTEGYGGDLAKKILATDYGPTPVGPVEDELAYERPFFPEESVTGVEEPEFNPLTAQGGISVVEQNMIDNYGYTANPDGTISRGDTIYDSEQGGFLQGGTAAMTPAEILAQQQRIASQASDLLAQQGGVQKTPEEMLQQIQETQARYRTGAPGAPAEAFDFGAPANVGDTYFDPMTNTTYEYTEKPLGNTGQTYQGWDIKSGTGNAVSGGFDYGGPWSGSTQPLPKRDLDFGNDFTGWLDFYNRQNPDHPDYDPGSLGAQTIDPGLEKYGPEGSPLQLFSGQPVDAGMNYGGGALAQAPAEDMVKRQGVASLMAGDPATEAMYQGIMS